ncbi:ABC transporter ATP-binding protein [Candidatus Contubernalis alkaliaceticus]|uniref:ABC transporter ATP-binding protein n=1 Tax=Candidatus Contubernalis alkaliaceticus TaxID=338645 RepID=UPI001F4BD24A|nr:ABC transporter ATP-binding protein [Candidatus Contubernalis alkalaceticus]UNC91035.1 ABC transporter ATP-binding protein [Candidatus Contubernalis alkalaceticus]
MFKVRNLKFKYPKSKEYTIDGIDFEISDGEIFGFLGPSAAGKSTTQKILIKLLKNFEGDIEYYGKPLSSYRDEFYQNIGVSFEMPISFSKLTALENLEFFKRLYKQTVDVEPLLKRLGLWEDKDKKAGEYSKGMKIRLNFIRALINKPKMLFLDEPTNGLDPANSRIMKDMIREFREQGGTVFLTSHIMSDVDELCDRVAFIAHGKLQEVDSPRNLKLKYGKRMVKVEYKEKGQLVTEEFSMAEIKTQPFFDLLKGKDIETLHSGETTLEEIFIKVTGVALRG